MTSILLLAIAGALITLGALVGMLHRERATRYVHGKTLGDDRLCEVKGPVFATLFLDLVDCPKCLTKASR